jgi:hypothetical protein
MYKGKNPKGAASFKNTADDKQRLLPKGIRLLML